MEDKPNSTSWFGDICQKFEALGFENGAWQEGLKYVEGQVQTIGANVMQFFSEYEPQSSFVEDAVCDSHEAKSSDEEEGVLEPYKVPEHDLPDSCKDLAVSVRNPSQAEQHGLELSYKITDENEDPDTTLVPPVADKLMASKVVLPDVSSSNSTVLAKSCNTLILEVKPIDDDSSTGLMRKNVSVNVDSRSASSDKTKLDESCILVDGSDFIEFSSVPIEARRSKPHKYKFGSHSISKRRPRKQDCGSQSDSKRIQKKGVGEAVATSSITSTSNREYYDSDWEIV